MKGSDLNLRYRAIVARKWPICILTGLFLLISGIVITLATINSRAAPGDCSAATTMCIETVTPGSGPVDGGTTVTITGANLAQLAMPMFTQVTAGRGTTCGIAIDGYTYCWGDGSNGRLGNGGTSSSNTPVRVQDSGPAGGKFSQISSGRYVTCGIGKADGWVYCWGQNWYDNLGSSGGDATTPRAIAQGQIPSGVTVVKVSVGETQVQIIGSNGWIYSWGYNDPRIGDGTTTNRSTPVKLAPGALPGGEGSVTFIDVSAGHWHGCGIISTGAAYCWGQGGSGRLGNGGTGNQNSPVEVIGGKTFSQISAGETSTCAVGTDGKAYCWGAGDNGRLGIAGSSANKTEPTEISPGAIPSGVNITQVSVSTAAAAGNATCAIADNGKAYCWGNGDVGELGNGNTGTSLSPVAVIQGAMPSGFTFKSISVGADNNCVIGGDDLAYCWGYGNVGRLGDGTTTNRSSPVKVLKSTAMDTYAPYTVTIGGAACTSPVITSTSITCTTSAHSSGSVEVFLSNGLDSTGRLNAFTYLPSGSSNISPNSGPSTGGTDVQITNSQELYKRVDGLIFTNPQGLGTGITAPTQFINTGIPQTGNIKVELQFKIADGSTCNYPTTASNTTGTSTMRIFGSWGSAWDNNSLTLQRLSNTSSGDTVVGNRCAFAVRRAVTPTEGPSATTVLPMGNNTFDTNVHTWIINPTTTSPTGSWDSTNLTSPTAPLPNANSSSMYLGYINNASGTTPGGSGLAGTVYYLKIWQDGNLVQDMIPVCNQAKTICGMQDKISNQFFGNAVTSGATAFTAGAFLDDEISVTFDGIAATNVSRLSEYAIAATTPAHKIGAVDVVMTVNGQKVTMPSSFTYRMTVNQVAPDHGPVAGGTAVTITGTDFLEDYRLAGYEPVEYLTFNGTQYINTGVNQLPTAKVQLDFQQTAATNNSMYIFGASNGAWDSNAYTLYKLNSADIGGSTIQNRYATRYGTAVGNGGNPNTSISFYPQLQDTNPHTWVQDGATTYWDGTYLGTKSANMSVPSVGMNMYLGTHNYNSTTGAPISSANWGASVNVFGLKIWKDGALARDFLPVRNKTTGVYGLWDKVNAVFYSANAGTLSGGTPVLPDYDVDFGGSPCIIADPSTDITATTIACTTTSHTAGLVDVTVTGGDSLSTDTLTDAYTYVELFLSLSASSVNIPLNWLVNGGQGNNYTIATVTTNSPTGYKLSMSTADDRLKCTVGANDYYMPSISAAGALAASNWGYGLASGVDGGGTPLAPASWQPISTAAAPLKTTAAPTTISGDDTPVFFGAKADVTTRPCTYSDVVTFTAIANI